MGASGSAPGRGLHRRVIETGMSDHSFTKHIMDLLKAAGLNGAVLIFEMPPNQRSFGNALSVLGLGSVLLRFVRDRGQLFLDVAPSTRPESYYPFWTVQAAMGWRAFDEPAPASDLDTLHDTLDCLSRHHDELQIAFSAANFSSTLTKLEKTSRELAALITTVQGPIQ